MIKKSRLRTQKKKGRRVILTLVMAIVIGAVGYQLEDHYGISDTIRQHWHAIKATFSEKGPVRGTIYDRNLKQLAINLERVSVYARIRELDSIDQTATRLSEILDLDKNKLEDQLESGVLRTWIAENISQEQEIAIKNLKLPGVQLQRDEQRYYPNDEQAAFFIGAAENSIGLSGVEFYYDRLLAGRKIKQRQEKQQLSSALDLTLTIDLKIQEILENLVRDVARIDQADRVAVYLLESETGEIIGGANLPGFNPNTFAKYSPEQTEDLFFVPLAMPEKFRIFLRDAIMLQSYGADQVSSAAWSLIPPKNGFGSQLQLWEWLGMEDSPATDFHVPSPTKKTQASKQQPVLPATVDFSFVPESATPLSLLRSYSILLHKGKKINPFVVKNIIDKETGDEVALSEKMMANEQSDLWSDEAGDRVTSLFYSQVRRGKSNSSFFWDSILVHEAHDGHRRLMINDMLFVTLPAGSHDLNMLLVVQRPPQGVSGADVSSNGSIEKLVEDKVERLSVLQQVAKSVADVVEAEVKGENNYQPKGKSVNELAPRVETISKKSGAPGLMPDLRGLSLRKSLRLLQGINVELKIEGTGRVIDQKPRPGTSLKGVKESVLVLMKQEDVSPEKLSGGRSGRK